MKALVINPEYLLVAEVEIKDDDILSELYRLIKTDMVEAVYLGNKHMLWVDEEGLLKNPKDFFMLNQNGQSYAGIGVILGVNEEGQSEDCTLTEKDLDILMTIPEVSSCVH